MREGKSTVLICTIGYAFHLVVISLIGWNGTLLFLPESVDTDEILFWFNATQLIAFPTTFLIGAFASQKWLIERYSKGITALAALMSFAGVLLLISCIIGAEENETELLFAIAGLLTGVGNSLFFLSWQNVLAVQANSSIVFELAVGTGAAGIIYLAAIQAKPAWLPLTVLAVSFIANVVLLLRAISMTKANVVNEASSRVDRDMCRILFDRLWQPALCIASLAFARGVAPALVLDDPVYGSPLSTLMTFGRVASAVLFFFLWRKYSPNVSFWTDRLYSIAVILVATGFVLLPLFGKEYQFVFAILAYTIFSIASLFMMLLCASTARKYHVRSLTVYGCFAGFVYVFSRIGFGTTYFAHVQTEFGVVQLMMLALVSVYILLLIYFASRRKQSRMSGRQEREDELQRYELANPGASDVGEGELTATAVSVKDALHGACLAMAQEAGLSDRETEIMEYLAVGRSVPYIAEALFISENTVRTHCKSIYRKFGIHSKRELMDLVEKANN